MRAALVQFTGSDDPAENLATVARLFDEAVAKGADMVLTPEVTNCISTSRARQNEVLSHEADDPLLAALRERAAEARKWCLIGSLALKSGDAQGRLVNRSFLIAPDGGIVARYDKIHMFDVEISASESYRESLGYRPGERAVIAETDLGTVGLSICYDIRFPALYRRLARAGAQILAVPSAFSPLTGAAHWEVLLRARAIETGSFVLAPAQTGEHPARTGRPRRTYGHSMAIGPWGDVLADAGEAPGVTCVDLDLDEVETARRRIPALQAQSDFEGPA